MQETLSDWPQGLPHCCLHAIIGTPLLHWGAPRHESLCSATCAPLSAQLPNMKGAQMWFDDLEG